MPQLFRVGNYIIYFWANENNPLEPLHIHIAEGRPQADATKIWITRTGHCITAHNKSQIPPAVLKKLIRLIEANSAMIEAQWLEMFEEIQYFC